MSIPINYNGKKFYIVDSKTLSKHNVLFSGFLFLSGTRYKKYIGYDKLFLLEV